MTKPNWLLSLALCAAGMATALAETATAPRIPAEDFARGPAVFNALISPDGNAVVYQVIFEKEGGVAFMDMKTHKTEVVEAPFRSTPLQYGIYQNYTWIGAKRIVYSSTGQGTTARDYDNIHDVSLRGGAVLHAFTGKHEGETLQLYADHPVGLRDAQFYMLGYPSISKIDTYIGTRGIYLMNPGNVLRWMTDADGVVRIGVETQGGQNRVIYRESENAGWHVLRGLDYRDPAAQALGLAGDGKTLYIGRVTPEGKWGVYAYDIPSQRLGDLILAHGRYDIVPPYSAIPNDTYPMVGHDGLGMQALIFSRVQHELLGIRYVTNRPQTFWLDSTLRAIQGAVDQALLKSINTITSFSDDLSKAVILSWTASDPGAYYLFDLNKKSLEPLFPKIPSRMPWIKPKQMATVYPISYKARDGLVIEGYLTVPAGVEPKHLSLIVNPHDGPWARDSLEFEPMAQFLANRGYAVLQMNFRGSTGYGEDFLRMGRRELGRKIQEDIADGTRWAIEKGIADPARIGIMGFGFGGYSTLMGMIGTPELYRCGIDMGGMTDWPSYIGNYHELRRLSGALATEPFIKDNIGDPDRDLAELNAISPVTLADKIRAPLLIVHGKDDPTVPYTDVKRLMANLDQARRPYEVMAVRNEMHGFGGYEDLLALYKRIDEFLAKNMPVDAGHALTDPPATQPQTSQRP